MVTDPVPRPKGRKEEYARSDELGALVIGEDSRLPEIALLLEQALETGETRPVWLASSAFVVEAARLFEVQAPEVKVLAARPLRSREGYATELFGDYDLDSALIRVWMRTAVHKRVTAFGTFLSTLCHEFCHHLDLKKLGLPSTPHTRGFYSRTAVLYHHARGTPVKPIAWMPRTDGRWQVDWKRTRSG